MTNEQPVPDEALAVNEKARGKDVDSTPKG